eukprot:GHUV01014686.1.p1 GENE.GHUV01014686.1~~GHUV01014686.1.p1  ORF type:complete len:952 (+),score=416.02 GHUV01014686.1:1010-3865(+)
MTGMRPPGPYTAQPTGPGYSSGPPSGGFVPPGSGPPSAGYTGAMPPAAGPTGQGLGPVAGPTGGVAGLPGFPPVTPADMQRYQAAFLQTDTDRDGLVKGSECFPMFMLSGLDKGMLKRMWDMVAGNAGALNAEQFFKCMYIMDGCRRGAQLPAVLPPGIWPQVTMPGAAAGYTGTQSLPGSARVSASGAVSAAGAAAAGPTGVTPGSAPLPAESWSLENQFGAKGAQKAVSEAYDQTLPKVPDLPGKFTFEGRPPSISGASQVPDLDTAVADMLAPADKARWEAERQETLEKERMQKEAEAETAAAKARVEAYQQALSELVMFKSRVDVALLQASDAAARLAAEAEDTELRYNRARLAAQSQEEEGNQARQKLQALLARKQEAANKLELLQEELAMMQNFNPAELAALEKDVGKLVAEAAAAESKKAALEMQLDSGKKQKSLLADRITDLEMAAAAGEGDIRRAREELEYLQAKVSAAQDTALSPGQLGEVGPLLGKAASAYRRLYSSAMAAGIEIPYEANLNNVGALVWLEQLMAGAADWVDDDSLVAGYTVVNALPDLEGVPPALLRAAALAAEQQQPLKPAAVMAVRSEQGQNDTAAADGAATAVDGQAPDAAVGGAAAISGSPKKGTSPPKGAAVAAIAAVSAAAAAGAAVGGEVIAHDSSAGSQRSSAGSEAAAATAAEEPALEAVAALPAEAIDMAVAAPDAGPDSSFEDNAFGDNAFGDNAFEGSAAAEGTAAAAAGDNAFGDEAAFPTAAVAAEVTPAALASDAANTVPLKQQEHVAGMAVPVVEDSLTAAEAGAGAEDAAVEPAEDAGAAAAAEDLQPSVSEAAVAFGEDFGGARKSLADEDDSDIGVSSPFAPAALSAVPAAGELGLASFDPAMYRLNTDQRLGQQNSMDSSVAGSIVAAGATGASSASGFEDDAFGDNVNSGHKETTGPGAVMAFEDNAF